MTLLLLGSGPGSGSGSGSANDPNWTSVKLLCGFEGTNGSTGSPGMTDESSAAHGTATVSSATIDTGQFKYGASSLKFTGTGVIKWTDSADWDFGSGNFTVEVFVRFNVATGTQMLFGQWQNPGTSKAWAIRLNSGALEWLASTDGSTQLTDMTYAWSPSTGTWYHVCVDYNGSKYRLYVDGVMRASSTTARTLFNSTYVLSLGSDAATLSWPLNGWLDELRITKGVARYASDSGYSVPSAAFPRS
jgi:hypothetical protein